MPARHTKVGPQQEKQRVAVRSAAQRRVVLEALGAVANRLNFAQTHGRSFYDQALGTYKRNLYEAAGYDEELDANKYWDRYRRNGVARRLVNALPNATWRAGAELIEDDDPGIETAFELAWMGLEQRLNVWDRIRKADTLAQLGSYSVVLIGAGGALNEPLPRAPSSGGTIPYLKPYSERHVTIDEKDLVGYPFNGATDDPRFGQPELYTIRIGATASSSSGSKGRSSGTSSGKERKVHWTRVLHVADEALEDDLYGETRLASVWNWMDDLEKVAASGSEAFWRRVIPDVIASLEPGVIMDATAEADVETEIDNLVHGLRRWARIQGVKLDQLGTGEVADFSNPIDALIGLIVAGYGIPKRILMGSERGELASQQDRSNWDQQVRDRRGQFGEAVVEQLVNRLVQYGYLPRPAEWEVDGASGYYVQWPDIVDLDEADKLAMAERMAKTNQAQGERVFTTSEIRASVGREPLEEEEMDLDGVVEDEPPVEGDDEGADDEPQPLAARRARLRAAKRRDFPFTGRSYARAADPATCDHPEDTRLDMRAHDDTDPSWLCTLCGHRERGEAVA